MSWSLLTIGITEEPRGAALLAAEEGGGASLVASSTDIVGSDLIGFSFRA